MTIQFKELSIRNFLSFGNSEEVICLEKSGLTLILGQNKDKGDDPNQRNGVGKSSIVSAIHFALFGISIGNKIKKGNLTNKINKRECEVSLTFVKNDIEYKIERGRNPEYLKFYVNGEEKAQSENKDTQFDIGVVLGMTTEMFNQIVLLTTYVNSFLDLPIKDQRVIIENLLGISVFSQKSETLKEIIKNNKSEIEKERVRNETITQSNQNLREQTEKRIKELESKSEIWETDHKEKLTLSESALSELEKIDIEKELLLQKELEEWTKLKNQIETLDQEYKKNKKEYDKINDDVLTLEEQIITFEKTIDIEKELLSHEELEKWCKLKEEENKKLEEYEKNKKEYDKLTSSIKKIGKKLEELKSEYEIAKKDVCPTCGQKLSDGHKHKEIISSYEDSIKDYQNQIHEQDVELLELNNLISSFEEVKLPKKPKTEFPSKDDVYTFKQELSNMKTSLLFKQSELDKIKKLVDDYVPQTLPKKPKTFYNTFELAYQHKNNIDYLKRDIEELKNQSNPYTDHIKDMLENTKYQSIDDKKLKEMEDDLSHQDFLLKLLTDTNSFIRKNILDSNLTFLNKKLSKYLGKMGSHHEIIFNSDMSIDIRLKGEDYDFSSLSGGEKARVTLALTLAFRECWEALNEGINLLFVDEIMDNGLDAAGAEAGIDLLKMITQEQHKNIFVVSHREEMINKVPTVLQVIMNGGFSNIIVD